MIVHRNGQNALRSVLTDNVAVEMRLYVLRRLVVNDMVEERDERARVEALIRLLLERGEWV